MRRVAEPVPFIRIDGIGGRYPERPERVLELLGLRCRTLDVFGTDTGKDRRLDVADKVYRRGTGVYLRIVIHRGAEIRDHPLVDAVFAVIGQPVTDAGEGDPSLETVRLGHRPHGHEAAIAAACDPQPRLI